MTLRLAGAVVPKNTKLPLTIDGTEVLNGPVPEVVSLSKASGTWKVVDAPANKTGKRHGVQGPVGDAFNSRFLAVYGENDRELAIAELDAVRDATDRLALHGEFPMKAAAKVTKEDIASSNLILFGTPASNPILKRLAPSLPAKLMEAAGKDGGVVFICPNPENPDRYVVVWTTKLLSLPDNGLRAGFLQPVNLLPDYVVVTGGKVESAGHFDADWKLVEGPK